MKSIQFGLNILHYNTLFLEIVKFKNKCILIEENKMCFLIFYTLISNYNPPFPSKKNLQYFLQ